MDRSTQENSNTAGGLGRRLVVALVVGLGVLMAPSVAHAQTPAGPDYNTAIKNAVDSGVSVITSNVLLLFALPAIWVGYKVARKVISKVG